MSTRRLTRDERAAYLVGAAILRSLEGWPDDPGKLRELPIICAWIVGGASIKDCAYLLEVAGLDVAELDGLDPPPPTEAGPDDDAEIPF